MKPGKTILTVALIGAAFLGGFGYGRWYVPRTGTNPQSERKILYYVDPMHPGYKSDRPGVAPDCGMKLEPVYADGGSPVSVPRPEDKAALPMGTIQIALEKQQLIGVQFGQAEYTVAGETLRAVGKVVMDETRVVRVHPKVEGWIERVHVDFTGAPVRKGEPLLTLYSPEMLASEKEYLLSLKAREIMRQGAMPSAVANSDSLVEASRRRLELWDLNNPQIDELERTGKPIHSITIYSPATGFVTSRNSFPSQRVTPETELYAIADLSRVWIMADVFETDIPKLRIGQMATVRMPYQSGGGFAARVNYVQPQVDPQTRTIKLRLEAANAAMQLKPEMFVDVEFRLASNRQLTVPVDAVLDAGQRQMVFVDRGNGYLEPRQVQVGERLGERVVIVAGLQAGERIATSANFLIDSESQLKSAIAGMGGHQHGALPKDGGKQAPSPGRGHPHD
jgi:RND family efflux transporter MFP subunit